MGCSRTQRRTRVRILRPTSSSRLVSARVFEHGFRAAMARVAVIDFVPFENWAQALLSGDADGLDRLTDSYEFVCPSYDGVPLLPLFLRARNERRSATRLLLIAHAPGAWALEWALIRPLLVPGDTIVAPSRSAQTLIEFFAPDLAEFVRVVPHSVPALPATPRHDNSYAVACVCNMHPDKLLHRVLDALEILNRRAGLDVHLRVASPLSDDHGQEFPYLRTLRVRANRLGLEKRIEWVGLIENQKQKAHLVRSADVLVNLSVSIEESFGKSVVEALSLGVPVLTTRWDGLIESMGPGGRLVPVNEGGQDLGVDVSAQNVADELEHLLEDPPSAEICLEHASCFAPGVIGARYAAALEEAVDLGHATQTGLRVPDRHMRACPDSGLLSVVAPLTCLAWEDAFQMHVDTLQGHSEPSSGAQLRNLLSVATRRHIAYFLAGIHQSVALGSFTALDTTLKSPVGSRWSGVLSNAVHAPGTLASRVACLETLFQMGHVNDAAELIGPLLDRHPHSGGLLLLGAAIAWRVGQPDRALTILTAITGLTWNSESAALCLPMFARLTRELGQPHIALPMLRHWLDWHPDAPLSPSVWQEYALTASACGPPESDHVREALARLASFVSNPSRAVT